MDSFTRDAISKAARSARTEEDLWIAVTMACAAMEATPQADGQLFNTWIGGTGRSVICRAMPGLLTPSMVGKLVECALGRGCDEAAILLSGYAESLHEYNMEAMLVWLSNIQCGDSNVHWSKCLKRMKSTISKVCGGDDE